jgi:regulator of sigma E protease
MELILTALLIIVFFAVLILGHETGHFAASKLLRLEVQEFGFGLPPKIFSRKWRGTEYSINAIPFGGFVKVPALDYSNGSEFKIPTWKKIVVFSSGVFMNFIISWVVFSIIFMIGTPKGVYVGGVIEDSPAAQAGIVSGDKLVGFDSITPLIELIESNEGNILVLEVERQKEALSVEVVPISDGAKAKIGVELIESGVERENFFQSLWSGLSATGSFIVRIIGSFASMFRSGDFKGGAGPIGIFSAVRVAKDMGFVYFLQLMGVVSLNLMIVNFFPLPALDGGHILFLVIEKIRRKPLNQKVISRINSISYALLLLLMFVVTIRDIIRLF